MHRFHHSIGPAACAVLLAACATGPDQSAPAPTPTPAPAPTAGTSPTEQTTSPDEPAAAVLAEECTSPDGFTVSYPAGWSTNEAAEEGVPPCSLFDPDPEQLRTEGMEVPLDVAVSARVEAAPFEDMTRPAAHAEELDRRETVADDRAAVRVEQRETGEGLYPQGTTLTRWMVDLDGLTFVARASDVGEPDHGTKQQVLDDMVASVRFDESVLSACSADGLDADLEPQDLPDAVADTRAQIAEAAGDCDYDRLAELAGEELTYSFGAEGDPTGFWRRQEAEGNEPLRHLVELLDRPHGTIEELDPAEHVWPSAFAYDRWADVPASERDALRPLYDEEDFAGFERFGGYIGYRIGISADGDWLFFVAGD